MIGQLQIPVAVAALFAAACDHAAPEKANADAVKKAQTGVASFYSSESAGHKTANGETLNLNSMTAASRTLPLGSSAQVTNVETGHSVKVRINDRGPFANGRVIDLTPAAARHIGIERKDGVAQVRVKPIPARKHPSRSQ